MRRNGADPTFSAPDPALLSWHATARPTQASPTPAKLTPVQQREQAILVARSFKDQYLSGIAYLEDRGTTIAIVRPIQRHKGNVPHEIRVDPAGNVSVTRLASSSPVSSQRIGRWLLLAGGAFGPLLTLLLIAVS